LNIPKVQKDFLVNNLDNFSYEDIIKIVEKFGNSIEGSNKEVKSKRDEVKKQKDKYEVKKVEVKEQSEADDLLLDL